MLAQGTVGDIDHFWSVFTTRGYEARKGHGCGYARAFKLKDDPNQITILFKWESKEALEGFMSDPAAKEVMKAAGLTAPPTFKILQELGELDH